MLHHAWSRPAVGRDPITWNSRNIDGQRRGGATQCQPEMRYAARQTSWNSVGEARAAIFRWVTRHNTRRRNSTLGQICPIDFEQ